MADIRINALATTAASTASDDFVAVDGSANGTRKLNAFSPTFGGNLTVSGTGANTFGTTGKTVIQQLAGSGALAAGGWIYGVDEGLNLSPNGAGLNKKLVMAYFDGSAYRSALEFSNVSSGTATLKLSDYGGLTTVGGNLTVSGTGTSTFAGNVAVTGTGTNYTAIDTGSFVKFGNNQTSSNLQVGAQGFGGVIQGAQSGSAAYNILAQPYGGNLLIGTTTDGGQKLQVSGTAYVSGNTTFGGNLTATAGNKTLTIDNITNYGQNLVVNAAGSLSLILQNNGAATLTLDSSQNATFAGTVTGTQFKSASGSTSAGTGSATTILSLSGKSGQMYLVHASLNGINDAANYAAFATVVMDGTSARIVSNNATYMTITLSGTNVQATQTSGVTQTIVWKYTSV